VRFVVLIAMLAPCAFAAQTVSGQVVDSVTGASVAGVFVQLFPRGGEVARYIALADSQGRFRFEGVKEGAYFRLCAARGYWSVRPGEAGEPIVVKGEPLDMEVPIDRIPRISGRVLDPAGEPVAGATVWALWDNRGCSAPGCFPVTHKTQTDDKGAYSIADIEMPGNWLLSASAPASLKPPESSDDRRLGWTQTFYGNVTDPQLGARIAVRAAGDLFNLDIKLAAAPMRRVRGRVTDPGGKAAAKALVIVGKGFGTNLATVTANDGTFEFASVPDAEWRIAAHAAPAGTEKLWVSRTLTVKGHDPEAIELRLTEPFALHGRIVVDLPKGIAAPDLPHVILRELAEIPIAGDPRTPDGRFLGPTVDGEFAVDGIYPDAYEITVLEPPPPPFYLDSIRLGVRDALAEDVAILSDAERLTLTYKYGGGAVRGTIEDCGSAAVMLIPQEPELRRDQFMRVTKCSANGQFEFSGVRPGTYYGIAGHFTAHWREIGADDRLLNQAETVRVREGESTAAKIPVVR
jgi:hypothetical protein